MMNRKKTILCKNKQAENKYFHETLCQKLYGKLNNLNGNVILSSGEANAKRF